MDLFGIASSHPYLYVSIQSTAVSHFIPLAWFHVAPTSQTKSGHAPTKIHLGCLFILPKQQFSVVPPLLCLVEIVFPLPGKWMMLQYSSGFCILRLFNFRQYITIFIAVKSLNYTLKYSMQAGTAKTSELFPHILI
jgi:hypothetical protein